jgi:hypothetical protein
VRNQVKVILSLSVVEDTWKSMPSCEPEHDVGIEGEQEAKSGPFAFSGFWGLGRVGLHDDDEGIKTEGQCASLTDLNKGL